MGVDGTLLPRHRRPARREEGQILVFALVFLVLFGLLIAALLSQVDAHFAMTGIVRDQNAKVYAADGGIERHGGSQVQLRHLPLSRIIVPEGFNPRGQVEDDRELEQMAESIRRDGCLQPIRVRATEHGDYVLIAGERRYRAAV